MSATSKTKLRALGVVLAMGIATVAVAAPASASQTGYCNYYNVCLFSDTSYEGGIWQKSGDDYNYTNDYFSQTGQVKNVNDAASSVYNHGGSCNTNHFRNTSYSVYRMTTVRGYYYSSLTYDDDFSSHQWVC